MKIAIVGCGNIGLESAKLLCGRHSLVLINHSCPSELAAWIDQHGEVSFVLGDHEPVPGASPRDRAHRDLAGRALPQDDSKSSFTDVPQ